MISAKNGRGRALWDFLDWMLLPTPYLGPRPGPLWDFLELNRWDAPPNILARYATQDDTLPKRPVHLEG